jgi:transposase
MANRLKMAKIHSIQTLRAQGWSQRRIARALDVDRETVARYIRVAEGPQNQPNPPTGSEGPRDPPVGGQNQPNPPLGSVGPASRCEPFRELIRGALERGLSAQRIWQDLQSEQGFTGRYDSVKRFCRRLQRGQPLPFRRIEVAPGDEAQVDFGRGAPLVRPDGKRKYPHAFRIILSYSRKGYTETVDRQTTENFIRALENAFWHFGGVPKTLVIDNLRAAVAQADWFDPELNPKLQAFAAHYGTVILPTRAYTPRHKGKVERGVDYVQDNGLKGRTFDSLAAENHFLTEWEAAIADTRIHGTTRQQVGKVFAEVERPALLPLPAARFPFFQEAERIVNRDGHVEVAKAYYSAPPEYVGRRVWVRWDGHVVRIFDRQLQQIAIHAQHEPGRFTTNPQHIAPQKRSGIERGTAWWLRKAHAIGTEVGRWAETVLQQRGIHSIRVIMGLVSLAQRHRDIEIEEACHVARSHAAWRLRDVRNLLKRQVPPQEQFEFIQEHPLIRSLSDYGALVHTAFEEVHA